MQENSSAAAVRAEKKVTFPLAIVRACVCVCVCLTRSAYPSPNIFGVSIASRPQRRLKGKNNVNLQAKGAELSQNMASADNSNRRRRSGGGAAAGGGRGSTCICIRCFDDLFSYFLSFRGSPEEMEQRHKSRQIDKNLRREDKARRRQVVVYNSCNGDVSISSVVLL